MTFKHKLSARLALMRDRCVAVVAAVIALAAVHACRQPLTPAQPVTRIAISPRTLSLQQNQTSDFTVVGFTSTGDTASVAVTWSVTSGSISDTSTSSGKHYGRYKAGPDTGSVKVVAHGNPGGKTDTAAVTVTSAAVASVTVSPVSASEQVGQTVALSATTKDAAGNVLSGRTVTWASSNSAAATVSASGVVTGVAAGSATITALSEGQSGTAGITVTQLPVASVTVTPATASVMVGQVAQFTAIPKDANGFALAGRVVTWSSNNTAVATVNASGLATGVAVGSATITATSEGKNGTAVLTVSNVPVASVTVAPASGSVPAGQTLQFTATPKDASGTPLSGRVVTWMSSNASVATVNGSGLVYGVAAGSATITATSEGQSGTAAITVTPVPVASVTVAPASGSVPAGLTLQFTATPKDASGNPLSGRVVTWGSSNTAVATVNGSGLVMGVAAGSATITATSEGRSGTGAVTVTATATNPGTVSNLAVASVTDSSVTLSFTEVTDGTGLPASYDIRWGAGTFSWPSATDVARGSCTVPVAGTAIGATRSCTVLGLLSGVTYQFQLVAFRGTLNVNAVFGALSNLASGTTTASTAPVASVTVSPASANVVVGAVEQLTATLKDAAGNVLTGRTVTWASSALSVATVSGSGLVTGLVVGTAVITATSEGQSGTATITVIATPPGGVIFQSDWSTATGTAFTTVTDGGRWMNYWEFNNGTGVQLMSVVSGASINGPGGRNALKVLQRGPTYAANVQQDNVLPPSTDFYVRFYMRNDDTSPNGDHIVTVDTWGYSNLTFMRKTSSNTAWQFVISMYGCGFTYPIGHWGPTNATLSHGVWYRFEYYVHFVDATHIQVHPRVYDASGTQIFGDAEFRQEDYGASGSLSFGGRDDWTLASFYAAGHSFCVDPTMLTHFGMGNNGQAGAADTGLPWYFTGVQLRTDRWPGP
ncbi:MAG: hypothetical protein DMD74_08225 [Gemmatimonadetes bacterium]|nr:MAG: hypothetical protein DMD74_08225 [Gemmatimonadota bacterium]